MKINLSIILVLFMGCANDHLKNGKETNDQLITTTKEKQDTLTILEYGELMPLLYENARDIVSKKYSIRYKRVAGCVIEQSRKDSIDAENKRTYKELGKKLQLNAEEVLNKEINSEYSSIQFIDDLLRKNEDEEIERLKLNYFYYTKDRDIYKVYMMRGEPDLKVLKFRLKRVVKIDSTGKIVSSESKDEIMINDVKTLQNDKNN